MSDIRRYTKYDLELADEPEGEWVKYASIVNPDCVWGMGECIPDCPSCKRMDDLYGEWCKGHARGYEEGYGAAMDDGWGEPGHIKVAVDAERERIVTIIKTYYKVAPKAAVTLLNLIEGKDT